MNKKLLIGSIIAVTILIGVSFTSVVGYNSIESGVKASPLFNIRSSRAIDEDSEDLSCEYVGKGEDINFLIPNRDDERILFSRLIDILKKMNDKEIQINPLILNNQNMKDDIKQYLKDDFFNFDEQSDDTFWAFNTCIPGCLLGWLFELFILSIGVTLLVILLLLDGTVSSNLGTCWKDCAPETLQLFCSPTTQC